MAVINDPDKRWVLAAGGILTRLCDEHFNDLKSRHPKISLSEVLTDYFQVRKDVEFVAKLEWLTKEGSNAQYQTIAAQLRELGKDAVMASVASQPPPVQRLYQSVAETMDELGAEGSLAWDQSMLITLARWGNTMGFISDDAAWQAMFTAARRIQSSYPSWEVFGGRSLVGYRFWCWTLAVKNHARPTEDSYCREALQYLTKSPGSPWKLIPWDLPLGGEAIAPPAEPLATPLPSQATPAGDPSQRRRTRLNFE